jgi:hypothetical protein
MKLCAGPSSRPDCWTGIRGKTYVVSAHCVQPMALIRCWLAPAPPIAAFRAGHTEIFVKDMDGNAIDLGVLRAMVDMESNLSVTLAPR